MVAIRMPNGTRLTGWTWGMVLRQLWRTQYSQYATREELMDALAERARVWSGTTIRTTRGLSTFFTDLHKSGLLSIENRRKESPPTPLTFAGWHTWSQPLTDK